MLACDGVCTECCGLLNEMMDPMKFAIFRLGAVVFLMGVLLAGCSKPVERAQAVPPVQTLVLAQGVTENFRRFPGEVVAEKSTQMSFDVAGRIIERPAIQGMQAQQGDLLARLDPVNFEARLASANARLVNAREELGRRQQLRERGVISASEMDQFTTEFRVAEAEQREAQRALSDTRMVAPFNGRVARTLVDNQTSVQPKQPVLVFQDVSMLEVDIEVPEQLMARVATGLTEENAKEKLEARAEFPAIPGRTFDLVLKSFSTEATDAARTFRVTFDLAPQPGVNILPGMTCTVLLRDRTVVAQVAEVGIYSIPPQAVGALDGAAVVWRLDPATMTVSAVPVELVGPEGTSMRIRSEKLQPDDEVVTSGIRFLSEGMQVARMASSAR